jgi:prenyl protein peptidase
MISLMKPDHSFTEIVLISPLFFGLAHLHHGYRIFLEYGSDLFALKKAFLITAIQFTYTTLFGSFSAYCLLESGIITSILIHMFCNYMGLPDFSEPRLHIVGLCLFFSINLLFPWIWIKQSSNCYDAKYC